ncbi:hypothetical protein [Gemmatimonas groenlandica]|uniref:Uncharacterized protein n=1 Tax=Gemmatimonas groenlandica TaxID=2732249 RepID=A0A6M4ITI7_9BACT|nr:hypothetical protein [Gemmatimonas groenlandica]QJR36796.1 hypothetical protein HKW67_15360 [Gemmatimonas groenlandica]
MTVDLRIRLKRHADGSASLTCTRRDGSVTWQRLHGPTASVMPVHDLTHYAVESTLGFRRGFYGLLADGWEITDFAKPWPRGPIPDEALVVELIVGFFDAERRQGEAMTAEAFAVQAAQYVASREAVGKTIPAGRWQLSDGELESVRSLRDALLARWAAVPADGDLDLEYRTSN